MGSLSIWHWLIVLVIVVVFFGTSKLSNIGNDLGKAIRGFKDGIKGEEEKAAAKDDASSAQQDKDKTGL